MFLFIVSLMGIAHAVWICDVAYECIGDAINVTEFEIGSGGGYKTLYGPTTSIFSQSNVDCDGSFSCSHISSLSASTSISCFGANSCSFGPIISNSVTSLSLACHGANSCQYGNISSSVMSDASNVEMQCYGDQSCAHSRFDGGLFSTFSMNGYGSYSLMNATILSSNLCDLTFSGYYSGFGALIICKKGDNCTINCHGTGCFNLFIECYGNCTINTSKASSDSAIASPLLYDFSSSLSMNNDLLCTESNVSFDDNSEDEKGEDIIILGPICCRGRKSCRKVNKIERRTTKILPIVCSGGASCFQSNIYTENGGVECSGVWSCNFANINITEGSVYCIGSASCQQTKISRAQNVFCSGYGSCSEATISSMGSNTNIYFLGDGSGNGVSIYCDVGDICFIECAASSSCTSSTTAHCNGNCDVKCSEFSGCPEILTVNPSVSPTKEPNTESTDNDYTVRTILIIVGVLVCIIFVLLGTVIVLYRKNRNYKMDYHRVTSLSADDL